MRFSGSRRRQASSKPNHNGVEGGNDKRSHRGTREKRVSEGGRRLKEGTPPYDDESVGSWLRHI